MTHPRALAAVVLLTISLLIPSEARLSQVFHQDVGLAELTRQASWVLVVRMDTPPTRALTVPYAVTDKAGQPKEGSFTLPVARVIVEDVILTDGAAPHKGAALELYSPDALTMFELTLRYEATGVTKSPLFERFPGVDLLAPTSPGDRFIVFLRPPSDAMSQDGPYAKAWAAMASATRGMCPFTMSGAALPLSRRQEVEALLNPMAP